MMAYFIHTETKVVKPSELLEGDPETVTMVFPKRVVLTMQDGRKVDFLPGMHEVPLGISGHWYLEAMGAKQYEGKETKEKSRIHPFGLITKDIANFLVALGGPTDPKEQQEELDDVPADKYTGMITTMENWVKSGKLPEAPPPPSGVAQETGTAQPAVDPTADPSAKDDLTGKGAKPNGQPTGSGS